MQKKLAKGLWTTSDITNSLNGAIKNECRLKGKCMKMKYIRLLLIVSCVLLASCSKDESSSPFTKDDEKSVQSENSNGNADGEESAHYYVKYEAQSRSYDGFSRYSQISVKYTTEKLSMGSYYNSDKLKRVQSWEGVFGPFKKGQTVLLNVSGTNVSKVFGRISVNINKEPFVLKKEATHDMAVSLSYKIE